MTFEKALEAMKQGKKVKINFWEDSSSIHFNEYGMLETEYEDENFGKVFTLNGNHLLSDDWEIYEEPQKEPEMTYEKACKILDLILDYINVGEFEYITHCSFSEIAESVRMAIEAIENQNQTKLFFDGGNISEKELEELQRKLKECKLEVNPEKKCECECKCNHTVEDANLQEKMKQVLSRKFFELADTTTDSLAVSNMIEIYRLLFEVK